MVAIKREDNAKLARLVRNFFHATRRLQHGEPNFFVLFLE